MSSHTTCPGNTHIIQYTNCSKHRNSRSENCSKVNLFLLHFYSNRTNVEVSKSNYHLAIQLEKLVDMIESQIEFNHCAGCTQVL
jgi:hypothetical protein